MKAVLTLGTVVLTLLAGCSETPTSPTDPSATSSATINTGQFVGALSAGESRFYSFTVSRTGVISAMLASVTIPPRGAAIETPIGVGIGRPAGTGCPTLTSLTTAAALTTHAQLEAGSGVYCINVYDPGTLKTSVNFVVRFSYP
jgi:hypothetical protein